MARSRGGPGVDRAARPPGGRVAFVVSDEQRRARLALRHGLARGLADVHEAVRALVVLHGTDASGPYVAAWARVPGFATSDLDAALFERRTLVRQHAMRGTLWVTDLDLLPALVASPGARVAGAARRRLVRELELDGGFGDAAAWLDDVTAQVVAHLGDGRCRTAAELREEVPEAGRRFSSAPGTKFGQVMPVTVRLLTYLCASGVVVRGENRGGWTTSRPTWTLDTTWLGAPVPALDAGAAHTELVRRWLYAFGPGTERDVTWWLGSTLTAVRRSFAELGAVPVGLEGTDATGWLLPDDLEPAEPPEPWVALLPGLDPTTMGWAERHWYLGPYASEVVDAVGNAGPTIWVDGRVVGAWAATTGVVETVLLEELAPHARAAVDAQARRLETWLAGGGVAPTFPSPLFGGRRTRPVVGSRPAVGPGPEARPRSSGRG